MCTQAKTKGKRQIQLAAAIFLLILGILLTGGRAQAASSKIRLSKKKLTIGVSASKSLTLKGAKKKVRWSVSGRKLVAVTAKGKFRRKAVITAGKRTGTCYVVAKSGKKTYRCKITVKKTGSFKEKKLGKGSIDKTASFIARKTTTRKADGTFTGAVAGTAVRLFREASAAAPGGQNVLISPDSILTALAMLQNGAAGATRTEMEKALGGISAGKLNQYLAAFHQRITKSRLLKYQSANSIWYKKGKIKLKKAFLQKIVSYFGADVYSASFQSDTVKDINAWVYNKTFGKISSIISRLTPDARTVLINAVYFKGAWSDPYNAAETDTFTKESGGTQRVSMLKGTEKTWLTVNGADGFVKPYAGGTLAFLALLPPEGTSLDSYIKTLSGADLLSGYKNRVTSNVIVHTKIPEFSYDFELSLKGPLTNMGIQRAFSSAANFSGMTKYPVCVDQVLHKTHIDLNKDGTEAAAVTAIVMKANAFLPPEQNTEKYVYLDRPFVYAIIDTQTGLPLFIGSVKKI